MSHASRIAFLLEDVQELTDKVAKGKIPPQFLEHIKKKKDKDNEDEKDKKLPPWLKDNGKDKKAVILSTALDRAILEQLKKAFIAGQDSGFQASDEDVRNAGKEALAAYRELKISADKMPPPKWASGVPVALVKNLSSAIWELAYWTGAFQGPR